MSTKAAQLLRFDKLRVDLPWLRSGSWPTYLAAIALIAAATLLRMALGPLILNMPFITFYPAVLLATFVGGVPSGSVATVLAILSAWFFFVPPGYYSRIQELGLPNPLILFALIAVTNVAIVGALRAALARLGNLTRARQAHDAGKLQRLADALHNAAFGIVIVDVGTNTIEFANPAFAALRGLTVEQVVGTQGLGLYPPSEHMRVQSFIDMADRTGRSTYETEYLRSDKSSLPVQIDITSVRGPAGNRR